MYEFKHGLAHVIYKEQAKLKKDTVSTSSTGMSKLSIWNWAG